MFFLSCATFLKHIYMILFSCIALNGAQAIRNTMRIKKIYSKCLSDYLVAQRLVNMEVGAFESNSIIDSNQIVTIYKPKRKCHATENIYFTGFSGVGKCRTESKTIVQYPPQQQQHIINFCSNIIHRPYHSLNTRIHSACGHGHYTDAIRICQQFSESS